MRTLDIDWADLELAFRDATDAESWLDRESGEVMTLVRGFDDEKDVRDKLRRFPGRFLRLEPVDAGFTRDVMQRFIGRLAAGKLRRQLEEAVAGPGGISRTMALLKEDKASLLAFARLEQAELVKRVEEFLAQHGIKCGNAPPAPELFEGLPS